jgi:hypothetical protein
MRAGRWSEDVGGEIHGLLNHVSAGSPVFEELLFLKSCFPRYKKVIIKSYLNMCAPFKGCCNIANVMNKYDN